MVIVSRSQNNDGEGEIIHKDVLYIPVHPVSV